MIRNRTHACSRRAFAVVAADAPYTLRMQASQPNQTKDQPLAAEGKAVWDDSRLTNPHEVEDKAARVQSMFNSIAPAYDLNNRIHSMWRDQAWRRAAVRLTYPQKGDKVLDVACGTGDLTLAFAENSNVENVVGADFAFNMLSIARRKAATQANVDFIQCDAMNLPIPDQSVDIVSIAFGLRNVARPEVAINEFARVLRPGGRLVILEFCEPASGLFRAMYHLYSQRIMPVTAGLIARDKAGAYKYLPRSVNTFMTPPEMLKVMAESGFEKMSDDRLTFGIAAACVGVRSAD